ncbi:MAG: glycerophosphodiester phosphodiesterase family protein, partial [Candidatus Flemingiibacterium sp.]
MIEETQDLILEAHRGVSNEYPENTLAAFRAAKELGYGMIELDTKFTADDKCIFLHDATLNRTARLADGSELEKETRADSLTLDEIRELDAGIFMGERFKGEKIPTLEEVLDFAGEAGIPLKFDNVLWSHTPGQREIMFSAAESSKAVCGFTC